MRDEIRGRLGALGALSAKTQDAERAILERAERRLGEIGKEIDAARPRVMLDDEAAARYQALVLERGKLRLVVARAKAALGA